VVRKKSDFDFEQALIELEQLVEKMEQGDLGLEDSLSHFERGVALTRACQKALAEAEQKVHILLQDNGKEELVEFSSDDKKDNNDNSDA
jgi:exodeoxyribonuclease VII small subunit